MPSLNTTCLSQDNIFPTVQSWDNPPKDNGATMIKGRMEAFSDGVFAVIITIMVLEMKTPKGPGLADLQLVLPAFCSYVLSFIYVGIYWNNHHHLLQAALHVSGRILWANLHLLFWLSLIPFATNWMGETHFQRWPVAVYGTVLLLSALAYYILTRLLIAHHGAGSALASSIGDDQKGLLSLLVYFVSIPVSLVMPSLACAGYIAVAVMWLLPDPRIEKSLGH